MKGPSMLSRYSRSLLVALTLFVLTCAGVMLMGGPAWSAGGSDATLHVTGAEGISFAEEPPPAIFTHPVYRWQSGDLNAIVILAAAGPGDVSSLTVPDSQSAISVTSVCLSNLNADLKAKVAIVQYEDCNVAANPHVYFGHVYTITVTQQGYTFQRPFGPALVGTNITWTQAASDMSSFPATVKTFIQRFSTLQGN